MKPQENLKKMKEALIKTVEIIGVGTERTEDKDYKKLLSMMRVDLPLSDVAIDGLSYDTDSGWRTGGTIIYDTTTEEVLISSEEDRAHRNTNYVNIKMDFSIRSQPYKNDKWINVRFQADARMEKIEDKLDVAEAFAFMTKMVNNQ